MLLTEAEAAKRICPHLPVDSVELTHFGNKTERRVEKFVLCQAADCMMWRWGRVDRGFCGLAGQPDGSLLALRGEDL